MSDTKFTKGEWEAVIYSGEHKVEVWSGDDQIYANGSVTDKEMEFANAHLIAAAPDMYQMIDELSSELHTLILEVNLHRSRVINSQSETEPDYWDMQSLHEAQLLLKKAKGE